MECNQKWVQLQDILISAKVKILHEAPSEPFRAEIRGSIASPMGLKQYTDRNRTM